MLTRADPYNEEVQAPDIFLTSLPVVPFGTARLFHLKTRRRLAGVKNKRAVNFPKWEYWNTSWPCSISVTLMKGIPVFLTISAILRLHH